jgi:hypothetical protein
MTDIDGPPAWFDSPVKWREDVMVPATKREDINQAWRRIFGTYYVDEVEVEVYEGGDCRATLFESGRISIVGDGGDAQIRELPPGSKKPRRGGSVAQMSQRSVDFISGRAGSPMEELPTKTEPRLPFMSFQVVVVDDGMGDSKNLLFVLDRDGEIWAKEINKNGVAVSSTAAWMQSK